MEYELEFCDGGVSFPLGSDDNLDEKSLGADERVQILEMPSIIGPSTVEYGGEHPWIHQWMGSINLNDVAPFREGESFEGTVESVIGSLLEFFGNGSTPNGTTVDDFEWRVQVNKSSPNRRPDGYHTVLISWTPK